MQKVLVFGQMSEFLSTVIKSCRANFGVKWRVFFSTSIFVQKCQFLGKKNWISWEMLIFSNNCALLLKVNNLLENMLIFRKLWIFVHVQIFIRVFLLLENCYFDSKYDFIRWYFGKSVIFLVKFTFQVALFLFGKKYHFMQKVLVFDQMSEFLRTVIKSCRAKLWSKVTSVFLNSNFCAKMSILGKKNWISWEMLIFSNKCALLLKVNILLENMLIFRKLWLFVWLSIYIKKLSNSDKNFNFS